MTSLNKNFYNKILPVFLVAALMIGCTRDTEIEEPNLPRMFTPVGVRLTLAQTQVKIEWNPSLFSQDKDVQYSVEVSKDSSFQTAPAFAKVVDTTFIVVTDADIAIRQRYFARIKANATGGISESKHWIVSAPFTMTGEQIFVVPVPESDIIDNAVILRWTTTPGVTKIVITPPTGSPVDVVISAADNTAGFKLIGSLSGSTTYSAEIFAGAKSKGLLSFTTKATISCANVIDLREITGRPSVLADTIAIIPSGSIVILKRGLTYNIPATSLNKSITILSGSDFIPDLASVFMSSNFNLAAGAAIDSLVFKDLNMYSDDYNAKYIFNINQVGTIGKVRFENVRGHKFRGFFRIQTGGAGAQVTDLTIVNCVIDSLRDFSLVNTNNSNRVANILVSNTTLYNARKVIDHRSPGSNSIKFENCTFYNLPCGGASTPPGGIGGFYFIDLGTQNSASPIVITNCIFGKTWDELGLGNDARGIQAGAATTVSVTNSYQASDFISTNVNFQIAGLIPYSGTSFSLYTDPANGNFRIKDNAFAGKNNSGDPRWYD